MATSANPSNAIHLDIYGYHVEVRCAVGSVLDGLAEDFAFFCDVPVSGAPVIEIFEQDPPYDQVPNCEATVYTPRNVSYRRGSLTVVDYSGRALAIHDETTGGLRLYGRDPDLLYEAAYLFLLSQCGEALDARRLHRVHALGLSVNGSAALVLLPMGGGKSTLGTYLLSYQEVSLLSDDSPLIDRHGGLYAFPLRIGLLPGSEAGIPESQLRRINRMEFGPKLLVRYSWFAERVKPAAEPRFVFLGRRSLAVTCTILPTGRIAMLRGLFVNCVVGLGLFQGMEFVFHRGAGEIFRKALTAMARLRATVQLARRSKGFYLILGRDPDENARVLVEFLRSGASLAERHEKGHKLRQ